MTPQPSIALIMNLGSNLSWFQSVELWGREERVQVGQATISCEAIRLGQVSLRMDIP